VREELVHHILEDLIRDHLDRKHEGITRRAPHEGTGRKFERHSDGMAQPVGDEMGELVTLVGKSCGSVPRSLVILSVMHVNVVVLVSVEREAEEGTNDPS